MYTIESRVRYSECDETGKLSLVGVMNYLQDCSTFHSEDIGRGFKQLTSEGYAWVLATWQIQVDRLPQFGEKICVGTWSYQMKGLQASRSFVINDASGTNIVKADSTWYLMDIKEGKAARVPESESVYITGEPRVDLPPTPRKIALEGNAVDGPAILVSQQHLDTNKHVNNAQYVLMAVDTLVALGYSHKLRRIVVQYRSQARLSDTITPQVYTDETGFSVVLKDAESSTVFATVRLEG